MKKITQTIVKTRHALSMHTLSMHALSIIVMVTLMLASYSLTAQVAVNTTGDAANASAMLDVTSTTKGFLPPRMTKSDRDAITSPATGLLIYQTDNTTGLYEYNGSAWIKIATGTGSTASYYVGQLTQGGIVFYVDQTGEHGLVASLDDLSTWKVWSTNTSASSNAPSETDGATNTAAIVAQDGTADNAATLCNSYDDGAGHTDWYLPSARELYLLASQDLLIDKILNNDGDSNTNGFKEEYGATGSTDGLYWSSTEMDDGHAWYYDFPTGSLGNSDKSWGRRVRAIRSF